MQKLIHWLEVFWDWIYDALTWGVDAVIIAFTFAVRILFEGFLTVVQTFVAALDLGNYAIQYAAMWGGLDSRVAWFLGNLGIGTGLTILAGAILVRMLLNLIPAAFTRI